MYLIKDISYLNNHQWIIWIELIWILKYQRVIVDTWCLSLYWTFLFIWISRLNYLEYKIYLYTYLYKEILHLCLLHIWVLVTIIINLVKLWNTPKNCVLIATKPLTNNWHLKTTLPFNLTFSLCDFVVTSVL